MRYRQPIKIEKPLQSSRRFSLIVYQKNHAGIFKAQIMAENTENNKQLVNLSSSELKEKYRQKLEKRLM